MIKYFLPYGYIFRRDISRKIKSVVIPKNVSSIGSTAFMGCTSLESIVVDEQNTTYDSRNNCNAVISSTNELVLGCKNTIIPDGVTEIGGYSFRSCEGLTTLAIPESVESIGNNAFYGCTGLTSIEIPKNVSSIGTGNFQYCANLSRIVVDELNETYDSRNNCNAIINSDTNELVFGCKTTIIPSSVTSIGGEHSVNVRD